MQFYFGFRFYINTFKQIKNRNLGMDFLITIATSIAYFYSIYLLITKDNKTYFPTSGLLIFMISIGELLEDKAKNKTSLELSKLIKLNQMKANCVYGDKILKKELEECKVNDLIKILPNEKIPLDCVITEGKSDIDEAILTGESFPKTKTKGDKIYAATTNLTGTIYAKVIKDPKESTVARIIESVENTSLIKPKFQKKIDIFAKYFVYIIILASLITFIIYQFLRNDLKENIKIAITVLIITCPCAIGLAMPTSIAVAAGIGFKNKILYKDSKFFEILTKVNFVCFDKTGTLTEGKLKLQKIYGDKMYLPYLKSLELNSNHIIANAILNDENFINLRKYDALNLKILNGIGIKGTIEKQDVLVASFDYVNKNNFKNPFKEIAIENSEKGFLNVFLVVNNEVKNLITLSDKIKNSAFELIKFLKSKNIKTAIISGDNYNSVKYVADKLEIDKFYNSVMPFDKKDIIKEIQSENYIVSYIGDGINDILALKVADISFSISNHSEIAKDSADVIMLSDDLKLFKTAHKLSKLTKRNIVQNLLWTFIYNLTTIPLAISGLIPPEIGGFIHLFSSLFVIFNALRLKIYKFK